MSACLGVAKLVGVFGAFAFTELRLADLAEDLRGSMEEFIAD